MDNYEANNRPADFMPGEVINMPASVEAEQAVLGALLVDHLLQVRPPKPGDMLVKTIVTGELGADIAKTHGLSVTSRRQGCRTPFVRT